MEQWAAVWPPIVKPTSLLSIGLLPPAPPSGPVPERRCDGWRRTSPLRQACRRRSCPGSRRLRRIRSHSSYVAPQHPLLRFEAESRHWPGGAAISVCWQFR